MIRGDSTVSVPEFFDMYPDVKCDIVSVDGGHSHSVATKDLKNFRRAAAPNHVVSH